jgi:ubiquinone biosynthesis UbiH/UbiF/VisC/COQ6 family hydroxylase
MIEHQYDIVIVGSGIVGCSIAAILAKQTPYRIALLAKDTAKHSVQPSVQVSAIAEATWQYLQQHHLISDSMIAESGRYTAMQVTSPRGQHLYFDAKQLPAAQLGYIMHNHLLQQHIGQLLDTLPSLHQQNGELVHLEQSAQQVSLYLRGGAIWQAKLVIAADGARSLVRQCLSLATRSFGEPEHALTGVISMETPHQQMAKQVFRRNATLALLPLAAPDSAAFVWYGDSAQCAQRQQASKEMLAVEMQDLFRHSGCTGFKIIAPIHQQSFHCFHAQQYVMRRVVLLGDAAHVVHPVIGQGLNLALADVAALVSAMTGVNLHDYEAVARSLRHYQLVRYNTNSKFLWLAHYIKSCFDAPQISKWKAILGEQIFWWGDHHFTWWKKSAMVQAGSIELTNGGN